MQPNTDAKKKTTTLKLKIHETVRKYESRYTDERVLVGETVREYIALPKCRDIKKRGLKVALSAWKALNMRGGNR